MENKVILSSLAMDLKRVALGLNRKSFGMAERFLLEAIMRKDEVKMKELPSYMQHIIEQIGLLARQDSDKKAEDALMYSIRIQNYVIYK